MDFWVILYIIDWFLFFIDAVTVLYLGIFAVAALFSRKPVLTKSKNQSRFVIPNHFINPRFRRELKG